MRPFVAIALAGLGVVGAIAVVIALRSGGDSARPAVPAAVEVGRLTPTTDRDSGPGGFEPLTERDYAEARAILAADPRVRAITDDAALSITAEVPWYAANRQKTGVIFIVALQAPLTQTLEVLALQLEQVPIDGRPHRSFPTEIAVEAMTSIEVSIDLREGRVVGLMPGEGTRVVAGPGVATPDSTE